MRASSSRRLRVWQDALREGGRIWGCGSVRRRSPSAMTRRYLQPDSPAAFSLPAAAAASLLPRSPSLRAPPLMRNLPDRISLVALLPRQGEAVGVGGGQPCVFTLFTSDSVIILTRVVFLIAALCRASRRRLVAPASAFLPLLTLG